VRSGENSRFMVQGSRFGVILAFTLTLVMENLIRGEWAKRRRGEGIQGLRFKVRTMKPCNLITL
jgi:hypothetical protein